jgi:hypothetical protein
MRVIQFEPRLYIGRKAAIRVADTASVKPGCFHLDKETGVLTLNEKDASKTVRIKP